MSLSPEEFVERLQATAVVDGKAFGRLELLNEEQGKHFDAASQLKGFKALSSAFVCFFLESVELLNTSIRPKVTAPLSEHYALFIPRLNLNFQSLCAAELTGTFGYPYNAYASLRNTFDNAILTSAAIQGLTTFYAIEGLDTTSKDPTDPAAVKKLRMNTEYEVRKKMTGAESGLSASTLKEVARWDAMFDLETHGSRLSMTNAADWLKGAAPLSIVPKYEDAQFSMFLNRYCEVAWMVHRLIPLMVPAGMALSQDWAEKWRIIDDSFEIAVFSLTKQLGKPIGGAMVELVKAKFPFNEQSTFPL